jgi:predicted nucleotidyltransferase
MNLDSLINDYQSSIIYECISGSRAYGTVRQDSDEDIRGIFILPRSFDLMINLPMQQIADSRGDIVYYSLRRFIDLAFNANPNIIELLYMSDTLITKKTEYMDKLLENRSRFITKKSYHSHIGYALSQIKKVKGHNKWINNPQPKAEPQRENFIWIIHKDSKLPFRPVLLSETTINLSSCHVSSLEHCNDLYRLYLIGEGAEGVFKNGTIICQSISKNDESEKCIGLLIFNKNGYERSVKDFQHYWEWVNNRNEKRWQNQEKGLLDYDAKNMMHLFRLLYSGENILITGEPIIEFTGEKLELLVNILNGNYEYEELIALANKKLVKMENLYSK